MGLNDLLARATGFRLVPERYLEGAGFHHYRRATAVANREAHGVIDMMARHNGRPLSPQARRQAEAYAVEVLGGAEFAPWLCAYAALQGQFREGWMADNFYHLRVVPRIAGPISAVTGCKSFTQAVLKTEALPDIAYHIGGVFYDRDYAVIGREDLARIAAPFGHVYVKRDGSYGGSGVERVSSAALAGHVFAGDCVIQRPILPHALLASLSPRSLATLRVTTARGPDGTIGKRGAFLRLGRAHTDAVLAADSMDIAVLDDAGALDGLGYMSDWRALPAHPDTGMTLSGLCVPHFAEAVRVCLRLHAGVPHLPMIGWDVSVTDAGRVELIEWNGAHCDVKFCEAVNGPHFRDMGWERFAISSGKKA